MPPPYNLTLSSFSLNKSWVILRVNALTDPSRRGSPVSPLRGVVGPMGMPKLHLRMEGAPVALRVRPNLAPSQRGRGRDLTTTNRRGRSPLPTYTTYTIQNVCSILCAEGTGTGKVEDCKIGSDCEEKVKRGGKEWTCTPRDRWDRTSNQQRWKKKLWAKKIRKKGKNM